MASGQLNLRTVKLGDNADTSKNFLIQVPAVADGSLSIQTESGLALLAMAAGKVSFPSQGQSLTSPGYIKLPGGLILQWGTGVTSAGGAGTVTYPIPFPTGTLSVFASAIDSNGGAGLTYTVQVTPGTLATLSVFGRYSGNGSAINYSWLAIGN